MTLKVEAPPPTQQLTYTVTNERGWNDPPTSIFSPTNAGNRKRIDPRRRVHHNVNAGLGYYHHPTPQPQPPIYNGSQANTTHNVLQYNTPNANSTNFHHLHHSSSNPDLSHVNGSKPILHHAASVPNQLGEQAQVNESITQPGGYTTPPSNKCSTPPLMNNTNGSLTPPVMGSTVRKLSAPSTPHSLLNSAVFNQLGTPTMLQSSHLNRSSEIPLSTANDLQPYRNAVSPAPNLYNQSPVQMSGLPQMPVPNVANQNNFYAKCNFVPNLPQRGSPTAVLTAPPTAGFYAGTRRLSKSGSPGCSGHSSPIPSEFIENDSQLLNEAIKTLNDCRDKCFCSISSKVSEDISKRIAAFQSAWTSGKLSNEVKSNMAKLATELDKRNFPQANSLHKLLITGYSSEVMPWMIGIKKLISLSQQAVEENNKYQ